MDNETFKRKKAEQVGELARLVDDVRAWTKAHVDNPDDAQAVYRNLALLDSVIDDDPEESQAALAGFKACWHMLFDDANKHCEKRNVQGFRLRHTKAEVNEIEEALRTLHDEQPELGITKLRAMVGAKFGYEGDEKARAKTICRKTVCNPIKE